MGDEWDDGKVAFGHSFDGDEKFFGFDRGQGGGWFVKNENFCATIERLNNLHQLFLAFRKLPNFCVQIQAESILFANFKHLFFSSLQIEYFPGVRMPEDDIFDDTMSGDEFAMLMDHPDSKVDSIERGFEPDLFSSDEYLTFVRLILAEKDFHQGGFSCAILP